MTAVLQGGMTVNGKNILAFDIGSSNGRAMLGRLTGEKLELEELHRFSNDPVSLLGSIHWDVLRLFREIKEGLKKYSALYSGPLLSIGLDAWGVDYGLLDGRGRLMGNPYHYRDSRNDNIVEKISEIIPPREVFALTGNAISSHNTVYQLMSTKLQEPGVWERAATVLLMPDLLMYFMTGELASEYTNATTMQLMGKSRAGWCAELLDKLGISPGMLAPLQNPGAERGPLRLDIGRETGSGAIPVVATATHDTASAVAAIPDLDETSAFISSGSWSLIGVETGRTYVGDDVYRWGFTNEGGVGNRSLLLRNTVGMWIIQDCMREWNRYGKRIEYDGLIEAAEASAPFGPLINPDDGCFSLPGDMPQRIRRYCAGTGQRVPESEAEIARCIFESLALKYRNCIEKLETILGRTLNSLRIVGGGSRNGMLNRFTASAVHKPVYCGPAEATAIGNIMVQAMSSGMAGSLQDIRRIVKNSFPALVFEPEEQQEWDDAYERFFKLIQL